MIERSQPAATRMTGGEAVIRSLLRHGVDTIFGIPGVQTYSLFDAIHRAGDRLRLLCPRHEQSAGFMAFGYAKSTGRIGAYTVVPGPGVLNTGAALCSAYGASLPLVCITGQVPTDFIGSGKGHLHELPDQLSTLRGLTRWAARIDHPSEAPRRVADALHEASSGHPGPVALELPWDVLDMTAPVADDAPIRTASRPTLDPEVVTAAARLIEAARNPMIMVGSGALHASREVLALAELLQAPVVSHRSGRGIVSDDHPLGFTCVEGFERWSETDVLIGVGSRLELTWFRWPDRPPGLRTVGIDIDPAQHARFKPTVGIVGDSADALIELVARLRAAGVERPSRRRSFQQLKRSTAERISTVKPYIDFVRAIRAALPRDGFFVEEICQAGFTSYFGFPVYEPRSLVTNGYQGTLGFGYPTALGVKAGNPDKPVVAITGDGGFQFNLSELATAVQYDLGVVAVVFDNGAYGNVRRDQSRRFGRLTGAELTNPDFVRLAESYGVDAARARTPKQLEQLVRDAIEADRPALIEVPIESDGDVSPWRFLTPEARTTRT